MLSHSPHICIFNLTPSCSLSTSSLYIVPLSLHPHPHSNTIPLLLHLQFVCLLLSLHLHSHSDTIMLPLHLQFIRCPAFFTSASLIWHPHTPSPPLESTLFYSLPIYINNPTPSCSLSTSSWYVVLLFLHPCPQSDTITLPLHLQEVHCPTWQQWQHAQWWQWQHAQRM